MATTFSVSKQGETLIVAGLKVKDFLRLDAYLIPINVTTREIDYTSKKGRPLTAAEKIALDIVTIPTNLVKLIDAIQKEFPEYQVGITDHGGHRRSAKVDGQLIDLNKAVKGADGSQHKYGRGADISLRHRITGKYMDTAYLAVMVEAIMIKIGIKGGVGIYARAYNYIHVDVRGSWAAWFVTYDGKKCPAHGGRYVVFQKGHEAAGVLLIQRALIKLGGKYAECAPEDGKWGEKTDAAFRLFQISQGLVNKKGIPDCRYGKLSNKMLSKAVGYAVLPWAA